MYVYFAKYGYLYAQSKCIVKCAVKLCENLCIVKRILQNALPLYRELLFIFTKGNAVYQTQTLV